MDTKVKRHLKMTFWAACGAAVLLIAGCGGSGSAPTGSTGATGSTGGLSGGTGGSGAGGATLSVATPNLDATAASVQIEFLTGQGRAPNDQTVDISRENLLDASGTSYPSRLGDSLSIGLNMYTMNDFTIPTTVPTGQNSLQYANYELTINDLKISDSSGNVTTYTGEGGNYAVDQTFPIVGGAFNGRFEKIPVYLNDSVFGLATGTDGRQHPTFDRGLFLQDNTNVNTPPAVGGVPPLRGVLSDFVGFDLANDPDAPMFSDGVTKATNIFFSGDNIALGNATSGRFEELQPSAPIEGVYGTVSTSIINATTYTLQALDPRDYTNQKTISAGNGILRTVDTVVNNLGTFEVMLMPHSDDTNEQDVVAFVKPAGQSNKVTALYYGVADLQANTIQLWPLSQLQSAGVAGEIDGTLSGYVSKSGASTTTPSNVYFGSYSFTAPSGGLPTGFTASGRFFVFRQ